MYIGKCLPTTTAAGSWQCLFDGEIASRKGKRGYPDKHNGDSAAVGYFVKNPGLP